MSTNETTMLKLRASGADMPPPPPPPPSLLLLLLVVVLVQDLPGLSSHH